MKVWLAALVFLLLGCATPTVKETVTTPSITPTAAIAVLDVAEGMVWVNGEKANEGISLMVGDIIKTDAASSAEIHFYDSAVLRLSENTEVEIKDTGSSAERTLSLEQTSGQTWSRLLKLGGIANYQVETSTLTASVRGTGFTVTVTDEDSDVAVGEGAVEVTTKGATRERQLVKRLQHAKVSRAMKMEMNEMTSDRFMDENLEKDDKFINKMSDRFATKHPRVVRALKSQGYSDDDMHDWMRQLATGNMTKDQLRSLAEDAMQDLKESRIVNEQGEMRAETISRQ